MIIRKARLNDFEEYFKLSEKLYKEDELIFLDGWFIQMVSFKKNYKQIIKKEFKKQIYSPNHSIYFAEDNGEKAGFVKGYIKTYPECYQTNKEGYIQSLFVVDKYRRKGISTLLKNKIIEWFKSKKLKYVSLEILENNDNAMKIYQKWGFKQFSRNMKLKL